MNIDGQESTEVDPIITEHLFVISPDCRHNHHSVHEVRSLISGYLKQINCPVKVRHEFTDRCLAQYNSRPYMGDISHSAVDFSYITIRNYYETSHTKGPQNGTGANLKHKFRIRWGHLLRQRQIRRGAISNEGNMVILFYSITFAH